jgi:hypothetical protein
LLLYLQIPRSMSFACQIRDPDVVLPASIGQKRED